MNIMDGLMLLKKIGLFFLLISISLLSTSHAGRQLKFVTADFQKEELDATHEEVLGGQQLHHHDEMSEVHERLLKVNTKDYGRYDPAPALSKPRFKLIPN